MPRTGLGRLDVGVGNEMHVGPGDAAGIVGQDDGAVHLGQLAQALRRIFRVQQEAAAADVEHLGPIADDDEGALVRLKDAVEALPQRSAGCDRSQRVRHGCAAPAGESPP